MSNQIDHFMFLVSRALVNSVGFIGTHSGVCIAFVLLMVALLFSRSKKVR